MTTSLERVRRGARLLDEKVPDWFNKIDIETLSIASCLRCVLGQLFGYFGSEALSKLDLCWDTDEDIDYGFVDDDGFNDRLTSLWINEIKQRRSTKGAS